jgi:hypothetical protein
MRFKGKKPIFNYDDTWSLDATLSPIIAEGLKKFKEVIMKDNVAGYPQNIVDDHISPLKIQSIPTLMEDETKGVKKNPDYDKMDDVYFNKWLMIIDKMIYAFDTKEPELPEEKYLDMVVSDKPNEQGYFPCEFEILNQKIYDQVKKEDKEHQDKVREGLELFGKHYGALWW